MLKSLRKMVRGHKIADLVPPLATAPARLAAELLAMTCPLSIEGTPFFPACEQTRNRDPRGGHAAPLSLPLLATPFNISEDMGIKK